MSCIRYCIAVYGATTGQQTQRVQKCINFCARVLTGKRKFDRISSTLRSLGWLSADQLRDFHTVTVLRRVLVTSQPEELAALFVRNSELHSRDTRCSYMLCPPRIRSEMGRRRFAYRAASLYNALPAEAREAASRKAFRTSVKRSLLGT